MNRAGCHALVIAVATLVAGCTMRPDPAPASGAPTGRPTPSANSATARPTTTAAIASPVPTGGPPTAQLAAEGGDPVAGQLGTFTWKETGSDAPWLPGAPIAIGMGEPLSVALVDGPPIGSWVARARLGGTSQPARPLGDGSGIVAFGAPAAGVWSLAVEIHFADGSGVATYFWELHIG